MLFLQSENSNKSNKGSTSTRCRTHRAMPYLNRQSCDDNLKQSVTVILYGNYEKLLPKIQNQIIFI